jgi:hypothetical protein
MALRVIKQPIEAGAISFGKGPGERRSAAAFMVNQLAEWRQRLAHRDALRS